MEMSLISLIQLNSMTSSTSGVTALIVDSVVSYWSDSSDSWLMVSYWSDSSDSGLSGKLLEWQLW